MGSKIIQFLLLTLYFLSPIITSLIYLFEKPFFDFHLIASLLGIFSFIWMCFNILVMVKMRLIEKNSSLEWILKFHTIMAIVALSFGFTHALILVNLGRIYDTSQIYTGFTGSVILISLMTLATIFMTNRLINNKFFGNLRVSAYERKFKYSINKVLHNVTIAAVFVIFIHTLISYPSQSSMVMRISYFIFFNSTFIAWVYHKLVRRIRVETDPYIHRKVTWDTIADITPWIYQGAKNNWVVELLKETPSLYPCLQCGTCTSKCPVSIYTSGEYNSRHLIQFLFKGLENKIYVEKEPNVWQCTQCYTCAENCPQHVQLPEIIIFLRNKLAERNEAPDGFLNEAETVYNYGVSIPIQTAIVRRRMILGLPTNYEFDIKELQDIMDITGLKDIITNHKNMSNRDSDSINKLEESSEVKYYIEGS